MLTVETIARVRREHAKAKSVRAIARDLRLSRDTVTKYLRSDDTEGKYERHSQPFPKLGPFLAELAQLLERNERRQLRERLDKPMQNGPIPASTAPPRRKQPYEPRRKKGRGMPPRHSLRVWKLLRWRSFHLISKLLKNQRVRRRRSVGNRSPN